MFSATTNIHRVALIAILVLTSAMAVAPSAHAGWRFGIIGGPTVPRLNSEVLDSLRADVNNRSGLSIGAVIDLRADRHIGLRMEPMYSERSIGRTINDIEFGLIESTLNLTYAELPVMVKINSNPGGFNPYVVGGASVSYLLDAKEEFKDELGEMFFASDGDLTDMMQSFDYGYTFGAGVEIPFLFGELFVEGRYTEGMQSLWNMPELEDDTFYSGVQLLGGMTFPIGNDIQTQERPGNNPPPVQNPGGTRTREPMPVEIADGDGDDPNDEGNPRIFGEEMDDTCKIDIDIHIPAAQDASMPLVPENVDAAQGSWTLRNDDMDEDTAGIIANRLTNATDLLQVDGTPDLAMAGAVAAEDDLVRIDLHNPDKLDNVYLNAYAMAYEEKKDKVVTKKGFQPPSSANGKIKVWRTATRTGAVTLPYKTPGPTETLWVEGLKGGRYRLVLFHQPGGSLQKARRVKAKEKGNVHGARTNPDIELNVKKGDPSVKCWANVRLTVAIVNLRQVSSGTKKREHVFDIFWGGRPVLEADVWPGGGRFNWVTSGGLNGTWINGKAHGVKVKRNGAAPGGNNKVERLRASFESNVEAVNQVARGSAQYEHRLQLSYRSEGIFFTRQEPVTLMLPFRVDITPGGGLTRFNHASWGQAYAVAFNVTYNVYDQVGRRLVGPNDANNYKKLYGSRFQMYEALGMQLNAREANDKVTMRYQSPIKTARNFTLKIDTKQRSQAIPLKSPKSLSDGRFVDNFRLSLSNQLRGIVQQDIRENEALASQPIFQVRQDVMALLNNGNEAFDLAVARGQLLEILGPQARVGGGQWGGLGFRMVLGGAGGTTLDTRDPVRRASTHNP